VDTEKLFQIRRQKGFEIANKMKIASQDGIWLVPSKSHPDKNYIVTLGLNKSTCTCEDYTRHLLPCKHIFAVQIRVSDELNKNPPKIKERPTYPQDWPAYNKAQTQEKELFMKLLDELCKSAIQQLPEEPHKGRPKQSMQDMVFSSALKVFTTFSLRRFATDVKMAKELGYLQKVRR
jgi:hypothetical protein